MELLDFNLPIWSCDLDDDDPKSRLDNNWYSPAASLAEDQIAIAVKRHGFMRKRLGEICEPNGIQTGGSPEEDGDVGIIEGRNLRPNYIVPLFMKVANEPTDLAENDLLIGKDGEPGTVAVVMQPFLNYCKGIAIGNNVYRLRLDPQYRLAAAFISAFLNSRIGQAILRKRIAGGTTPTIRKSDISTVEILMPADLKCPREVEAAIVETQKRVIEYMDNLGPSKNIASLTGMTDLSMPLPTNWAGGGAARSSRIVR